jgi:hypothetical protein
VQSLIDAVNFFEKEGHIITPNSCRNNSLRFSSERFKEEIRSFVSAKIKEFQCN